MSPAIFLLEASIFSPSEIPRTVGSFLINFEKMSELSTSWKSPVDPD